MLKSVSLKLGNDKTPSLSIKDSSVTLLVGPNNSGKSLLLKEIEVFLQGRVPDKPFKILKDIQFQKMDYLLSQLDSWKRDKPEDNAYKSVVMRKEQNDWYRVNNETISHSRANLESYILDPNNKDLERYSFRNVIAKNFVSNISGAKRLSILDKQERGQADFPTSILARLLYDDAKRDKLQKIIYESIGLYFGIDIFSDVLVPMLSNSQNIDPRSLNAVNLEWVRSATPYAEWSDGYKAFIGILCGIFANGDRVVLLDEPEAFLHPPLAQKLGKAVCELSKEADAQIFIATHSPDFLLGAVHSSSKLEIVRLQKKSQTWQAHGLSQLELKKIMNDPVSRSANVLSGLFCDGVIVTEADGDRAFYQEINERLKYFSDDRAIEGVIFINGNGKNSLSKLASPLKAMGVPVAVIFDIDLLNEDWKTATKFSGIPVSSVSLFSQRRADIWKKMAAMGGKPKTEGGIHLLDESNKKIATSFIEEIKDYGIFVVPNGELECWLPSFRAKGKKQFWVCDMFELMGNDPQDDNYARPFDGDVWGFIGGIKSFFYKN